MNIIKIIPATEDKRVIYKLTKSKSTSVKDLEPGSVITPVRYCIFEDTNSKGEENTVLCIEDSSGETFSTISKTFARDFEEVAALMEDEAYQIKVINGTTKAGRPFVTCELVCD